MSLHFAIVYVSVGSVFIPLILGIWQLRSIKIDLKYIVLLTVSSACADGVSLLLVFNGFNSWGIVNLFFITQFILLYLTFAHQNEKGFFKLIFTCFVFFAVGNYFFIQSPIKFNDLTAYIGGIIMIVMAVHYLYKLLNELPVERIQHFPMLWVSFGVLVYFSGTLFLFLFNNYLIAHQPGNHKEIWILHNLLNLSKNIFFAIALWKNYKLKTSSE